MFNAFLEPCYPSGISTNGNRVVAAVALPATIPLASPKVTDYSIRPRRWRCYPLSTLRCVPRDTQRKTRGRADRYSFLVRNFHPLLHAGLTRRTVMACFHHLTWRLRFAL